MRIEESRFNCAALLYCSHSFGFQLFGRFLAFLTSSLSSIRLQSSVTSRLDEGMDSGQPGTLRPVHYTHHIKMRSHVIGWLTILLWQYLTIPPLFLLQCHGPYSTITVLIVCDKVLWGVSDVQPLGEPCIQQAVTPHSHTVLKTCVRKQTRGTKARSNFHKHALPHWSYVKHNQTSQMSITITATRNKHIYVFENSTHFQLPTSHVSTSTIWGRVLWWWGYMAAKQISKFIPRWKEEKDGESQSSKTSEVTKEKTDGWSWDSIQCQGTCSSRTRDFWFPSAALVLYRLFLLCSEAGGLFHWQEDLLQRSCPLRV